MSSAVVQWGCCHDARNCPNV